MPFKAYYLDNQGQLHQDIDENDIKRAFESEEGLLWVDIDNQTEEDGDFLERNFAFHPLTIQDCVDPAIHNPKVEDFGSYLFLVLRGINYTVESEIIETTELNLFLGNHFVVSNHNVFLHSVGAISRLVEEVDGRPMRRNAVFLAHAIVDALVDNIVPTIDRLSERVDALEDEVFESPRQSTLEKIVPLKRSSLRLRRLMTPQREVLNQLSRRDFSHISTEAQIYYRDIYDNVVRIEGLNENLRERADTALAMYLSVIANRQNETMRILSIVAAIFLPLGLLAGVYGMNFENIPELKVSWGYFFVVGFMLAVITITFWIFWIRRLVASSGRRLEKFIPSAVDPERLRRYVEHVAESGWRRL